MPACTTRRRRDGRGVRPPGTRPPALRRAPAGRVSDARIIDRGYRPYDGPRLGPAGAVRSLVRHTVQRVMGLRRPASAKILPVLSAGIAHVPALVVVGLAAPIKDPRVPRGAVAALRPQHRVILLAG